MLGAPVSALYMRTAGNGIGTPVVPVDCAGFYGTKNLGNRIAGEAMFRHAAKLVTDGVDLQLQTALTLLQMQIGGQTTAAKPPAEPTMEKP